jgi:hypothetical protein
MSQSYGAGTSSMSNEVANKASAVSSGQIPDLLKIGSVATNTQMDVDTDVLDPVVQNSKFIRFVLQNKGILHSHSKIQFGYQSTAVDGWCPLNIGIAGLVQRATLRVGNQTICEIDDFSNFTSYRQQFMSGEAQRERLQYTTGQAMGKKVKYNNEGDGWTSATPPVADEAAGVRLFGGGGSLTMSRGLDWDHGRSSYAEPGVYTAEIQAVEMPPYMNCNVADVSHPTTPTFQWALSDFFPFLKTNQLPLYMMKEQVSLEFVLNDEASVGRGFVESGGVATTAFALDTTKTKMFADYQYYPQEMMVAYANANRNLQFSYVDYRLSKLSFDEASTGVQIRNVGGAGRIVSKIVWGFSNPAGAGAGASNPASSPLINWNATAVDRTAAVSTLPPIAPSGVTIGYTNNALSMNVKMNNGFLYPIDVDNSARCFHNVVQAEGLVPYITREEYAREGNSLSRNTLQGHTTRDFLQGTAFWNATRLNRGERVNSRGIEVYFTLNPLPTLAAGTTYTMRCFLETIKFATLKDGMVSTMLA